MRQGPNARRSRGRGRNNNNNNNNSNSNKPHVSPRQQTFDSNGPDIRVRGNAYQVLEKYLAMARDASGAGDRISAENYLQHAEHYYRLINAHGDANGRNARSGGGDGTPSGHDQPDPGDEGDGEAETSGPNGNRRPVNGGQDETGDDAS
ncbi:MAG: DUF4167 domain-containing protein [Rhodospirillaceae bacterium]|nr:DUF4167 domain-containing protein [Rhodospirillaceae bacterium]